MTDNSSIDNILGNSFNIQNALRDLAVKYVGEDVDDHKAGLFGWINAVTSHIAKQSLFHRNSLYPEFFLNSASLPESIYSKATDYQVETPNATPAKATLLIEFDFQELYDYSTIISTTENIREIKLNRNKLKFHMGNVNFVLPYSLVFRFFGSTENSRMICFFNTSETDILPKYGDLYLKYPYVSAIVDTDDQDGRVKIKIEVDVYQITIWSHSYEVISTNISDRLFYNIDFENQLVDFNVFYLEIGNNTIVQLPKFINSAIHRNVEKYALYSYLDEDSYQVFFPAADGLFRPITGSRIILDTYTSLGTSGNIVFNKPVGFSYDENRLPITRLIEYVYIKNQPTGGQDRTSLLSIKKELLKKVKKVESLASEDDLREYFKNLANNVFGDLSDVKFVRRVDDVLSREFLVYLKIFDKEYKNPLGTNTVDFKVPYNEIERQNNNILQGNIIIFDSTSSEYRLLNYEEYPESYIDDPKSVTYINPFLIRISFDPTPRASYYNMLVNSATIMRYTNISGNDESTFLVRSLNITRGSIASTHIDISCDISSASVDHGLDDIIFYLLIKSHNDIPIGYVELINTTTNNTTTSRYTAQLETNNLIIDNGRLIIIDSIRSLDDGEVLSNAYITSDVNFDLCIFVDKGGVNIPAPSNSPPAMIPNTGSLIFHSYMSAVTPVQIFDPLGDVIKSDIEFNEEGMFTFYDVPVIALKNFQDKTRVEHFFERFYSYMFEFREAFKKLRNNTDINLKFFNTYGLSLHHSIDFVNIRLSLDVALNAPYSVNLDTRIKDHIVEFINNNNNNLNISNLTTSLEVTFIEINSINFNSINGLPMSEVKRIVSDQDLDTMNLTQPPEILGVDMLYSESGIPKPDITINYTTDTTY